MSTVNRTIEPVGRVAPARGPLPGTGRLLLLAVVTVLAAVALPVAPVRMAVPTVSWPEEPRAPRSTMLALTGQQPLGIEARFSCAAIAAAAETADGVVLATLVPGTGAAADGLVVRASEGRLVVRSRDEELVSAAVPAGPCTYTVRGAAGELVVERDGERLARAVAAPGAPVLPDVDVLVTSIERLTGDDDLAVRVVVDNQFNTTPTALKKVLIGVVLVGVLGCLLAARRIDRRRAPPAADLPGRAPREPLTALADLVVVGTLVLWAFIAPAVGDDGYYAAMARNATAEGFVGNYYQLLNQSFTPFTWFYRVIGWWQQVGDSPVLLRAPAVAAAVVTWALLRRVTSGPEALPRAVLASRGRRLAAVGLLAVTFLAWFLPFGMGVRPEAAVGLLTVAALVGVLSGLRHGRLLPIGLASAAAGLGFACHPTGVVALAPLLAAAPRLVALVADGVPRGRAAARAGLVVAPAALAAVVGFADGSLHDFLRGQEIFLSIQAQEGWYSEIERYAALLSSSPMGSWARRAAVLVGVAALAWFLLAVAASRGSGVRMPPPLLLAGASLAVALLLFWVTPSKWTHHFGALAGLGAAFLTLFLVWSGTLARQVTGPPRRAWWPVMALGTVVVTAALAARGPTAWPWTWLPGVPQPDVPPSVAGIPLGSLPLWAAAAALVVACLALVRRRRGVPGSAVLTAVPVLVAVFLAGTVGGLVGSFGYATVRTLDGWSPWAESLTDPLARDCAAGGALRVGDLDGVRPLPLAEPPAADPVEGVEGVEAPFVAGGGWGSAGPAPGGDAGLEVWGSLVPGAAPVATGGMRTPWFDLTAAGAPESLVVLASGRVGAPDALTVEYADTSGGRPRVVGEQQLGDDLGGPEWRTFPLSAGEPASLGADAVRLVATDGSGGPEGWLAFTAPAEMPRVPLDRAVPDGAAVAEGWRVSFVLPCQRQPVTRSGITESAGYAVEWRGASDIGLTTGPWRVGRGGLFAPLRRSGTVVALPTAISGAPGVRNLQALRILLPHPDGAYRLVVERVTRWGWHGP